MRASIVIPAHNEEQSIGRLLKTLAPLHDSRMLEVIVVCNGCSDETALVARSSGVNVLELPEPGKANALAVGDRLATGATRVYVDADIEVSAESILSLVSAVEDEEIEAAGPQRDIPRDGVHRMVAWYYDIWESLPTVRNGLFGRGVIALSEVGVRRVSQLPLTMSDDLAASDAFEAHERTIVESASVIIHPPKTVRDLIRRRSRVVTGNVLADRQSLRGAGSRTRIRDILFVLLSSPKSVGKVCVFLGIGLIARVRVLRALRIGDFATWERDESSRVSR